MSFTPEYFARLRQTVLGGIFERPSRAHSRPGPKKIFPGKKEEKSRGGRQVSRRRIRR